MGRVSSSGSLSSSRGGAAGTNAGLTTVLHRPGAQWSVVAGGTSAISTSGTRGTGNTSGIVGSVVAGVVEGTAGVVASLIREGGSLVLVSVENLPDNVAHFQVCKVGMQGERDTLPVFIFLYAIAGLLECVRFHRARAHSNRLKCAA